MTTKLTCVVRVEDRRKTPSASRSEHRHHQRRPEHHTNAHTATHPHQRPRRSNGQRSHTHSARRRRAWRLHFLARKREETWQPREPRRGRRRSTLRTGRKRSPRRAHSKVRSAAGCTGRRRCGRRLASTAARLDRRGHWHRERPVHFAPRPHPHRRQTRRRNPSPVRRLRSGGGRGPRGWGGFVAGRPGRPTRRRLRERSASHLLRPPGFHHVHNARSKPSHVVRERPHSQSTRRRTPRIRQEREKRVRTHHKLLQVLALRRPRVLVRSAKTSRNRGLGLDDCQPQRCKGRSLRLQGRAKECVRRANHLHQPRQPSRLHLSRSPRQHLRRAPTQHPRGHRLG